ncbi:MAG: UvrB/UvrC motif-containing protein [Patescibacteria group bacterium]
MKLIPLLHFYQPYNQQKDILDRIVNECYRPLVRGLLENSNTKIVVNISGALVDLLLENSYSDVIEGLNTLHTRNQIEFTGSAMYHAFLPLLPKEEIINQIQLNEKTLKKHFSSFSPVGFFSPEMAVSSKVLEVISSLNYKWLAAPQVAYGSDRPIPDKIFQENESNLYIMFRNKRVSSLLLSGVVRNSKQLLKETVDLQKTDSYWFVVMDAETFGHHRVGLDKVFFDVLSNGEIQSLTVSDLLSLEMPVEKVNLRASTWTNQEQDFWLDKEKKTATDAKSFILWSDPENPIHKLQWDLTNSVINEVNNYSNKSLDSWKKARQLLNKAIASDQYWWASVKPWWSLEMLEQGAFTLKEVLKLLNSESSDSYKKALSFYRQILDQAFEWQRSGYIREKHLINSSTYMKKPFKERTPTEWYNQIVLEFEDQMRKAAEKNNFEEAIKWRDALIKLKQGTDIYDVLHVVDELWSARNIPEVKPFLQHKWEELSSFAKEYFAGVPTKEAFEEWKKENSKQPSSK